MRVAVHFSCSSLHALQKAKHTAFCALFLLRVELAIMREANSKYPNLYKSCDVNSGTDGYGEDMWEESFSGQNHHGKMPSNYFFCLFVSFPYKCHINTYSLILANVGLGTYIC